MLHEADVLAIRKRQFANVIMEARTSRGSARIKVAEVVIPVSEKRTTTYNDSEIVLGVYISVVGMGCLLRGVYEVDHSIFMPARHTFGVNWKTKTCRSKSARTRRADVMVPDA